MVVQWVYRLKRRLREGARLVVIDPRRIELVGAPHIKSDYHLPVRPGANVALLNAIAHTIVDEGLADLEFVDARCEKVAFLYGVLSTSHFNTASINILVSHIKCKTYLSC